MNRCGFAAWAASMVVVPLGTYLGRPAVVHRGRRVQGDPGVAVLVVVVADELLAEGAGVAAIDPNRSGKRGST